MCIRDRPKESSDIRSLFITNKRGKNISTSTCTECIFIYLEMAADFDFHLSQVGEVQIKIREE